MSVKSQQTRFKTFSIFTFVVLLSAFAYYYFIYVNNKKDTFNEKAFRIIENVGDNIETKFSNYSKIVKNAHADIVQSNIELRTAVNQPKQLRAIFDNKQVPTSIKVLSVDIDATKSDDNTTYNIVSKTLLKDNSVIINSFADTESDPNVIIESSVAYDFNSLFQNVFPREFFKKYIIFSKSRVYYSDVASAEYQEIELDSLFKKETSKLNNLFYSSDVAEIEFNNESQLLYITPINVSGSTTIFLAGIVEKSFYLQNSFELGTNTLIILSIVVILLILAIPFIKLAFMSKDERMVTSDAILSFLVVILGSAFVILSFLAIFTQEGPTNTDSIRFVKSYAKSIEKNFLSEIDSILIQIDKAESEMPVFRNSNEKYPYDLSFMDIEQHAAAYPYVDAINWSNSNGDQLVKWNKHAITPRVNLRFRKYFSVPNDRNNNLWVRDSLDSQNGFFIESIFSVTTGISYASISRRSKVGVLDGFSDDVTNNVPTVVNLITNFQSLTSLPLPSNISYVIIDKTGEALFHQNMAKVLQENVFDEMSQSVELFDAVNSKSEISFDTYYDEKSCKAYAKPISNMPFFLLVLMDKEEQNINNVRVLGLSSMFYVIMFMLFLFQIGLFILIDMDHTTKTKAKNIIFRPIWPNPSKQTRYLYLIAYTLISLLIYFLGGLYQNVILTYSFFSLLITVNILVLRRFDGIKEIYRSPRYTVYFITVLVLGLLLAYNAQPKMSDCGFLVFLIITVVVVFYSFKIKKNTKAGNLKLIYNLWMFMFVISLASAPAIGFFTRAYNFEKLLYTKNLQYDLANNIIEGKFEKKDNIYKDYSILNRYFKIDSAIDVKPFSGVMPNEDKLIDEIRFKIRGKLRRADIHNIDEKNQLFFWREESGKKSTKLYYYYKSLYHYIFNQRVISRRLFTVESEKIEVNPNQILTMDKGSFGGKAYYLGMSFLLFIVGLFYLVSYWSRTMYLLGIIPKMSPSILQLIQNSSFIYIISPPYVGIADYLKNELNEGHQFLDTMFASIDYQKDNPNQLDIQIDYTKEIIVVFDNGKKDPEELRKKMLLVSQLKTAYYDDTSMIRKIIFVSHLTPHQISSHYKDKYSHTDDKIILENYFDVLGDFVTSYYPIDPYKTTTEKEHIHLISEELEPVTVFTYGKYWESITKSGLDREDMLLNIQNKAQLYYYALWTSLEKRERFLIYDLAQDGLINYRNIYVIYNLLSRGFILYRSGRLKLFNQSFANFVLTIIDKDEALELEKELSSHGRWNSLRLPLFTLIGGALVFIFLTQQEALNDLMGWLTAALALIPLLARLMVGIPWLGKKSKSKEATS